MTKNLDRAFGTGICEACGKEANFKIEDFGIGAYEFWGAKGTHHDYQWISECCEAAPEEGTLEIDEPDYGARYPDRPYWDRLPHDWEGDY